MPSFSRTDIVLVRYPFSDLSGTKVRPAAVISAPHTSSDLLDSSSDLRVVPLTSRTTSWRPGEFVLSGWRAARLNVPSAVKRGVFTIAETLILKRGGTLAMSDTRTLEQSLRAWLAL